MPVFSIPLSGLTANSTALSAIANNLANLNTVGYQQTRAVFRDMFYQNIGESGSGNPIQLGAGSQIGALTTVFGGGSIESSGLATDVAISGNGFFVLKNAEDYRFTRAGNFHVGPDGNLLSENGEQVMGYPALSGAIPAGQALGPLQVGKGQISPPSATTSMGMGVNLDASAEVGSSYSVPITVFDSLGAEHILTFRFNKTDNNSWNYDISIPSAEIGGSGERTTVAQGSLTFDGTGKLTVPASDVGNISVAGLANGAADISLTWNLYQDGAGMLTQLASPNNTSLPHQDGCGAGMLLDFAIGDDGTIMGSFSNGKTMMLGQLALASFANPEGLSRSGGTNFSSTRSSGVPVIGAPDTGGRGTVVGGALELSNVDIAKEFAQMITAQRGFQASARAITTFDEIAQETINLKR